MPTIHDCERCTKQCPQRQLAREQAEKRMYVTNEFVSLQKDIDSGKYVEVVNSFWLYNAMTGDIRCSHCNFVAGNAESVATVNEFRRIHKYCYNCGAKMPEED